MANNNQNSHRWKELCDKYKQLRTRGGEDNFRLGRLAIHLRDAWVEACGCEESYIDFYTFKHGTTPEFDSYKKAKTGWSAVSHTETGWVFALSILLEAGPNASPKTAVICPIDVEIDGYDFNVKSTLFSGVERIHGNLPSYDAVQACG